jgi:hypothetical protein
MTMFTLFFLLPIALTVASLLTVLPFAIAYHVSRATAPTTVAPDAEWSALMAELDAPTAPR